VDLVAVWLVAAQQDRREERATFGVRVEHVDVFGVAEHDLARVAQRLERSAHLLALLEAGERPHPHSGVGGITDHHSGEPGA